MKGGHKFEIFKKVKTKFLHFRIAYTFLNAEQRPFFKIRIITYVTAITMLLNQKLNLN